MRTKTQGNSDAPKELPPNLAPCRPPTWSSTIPALFLMSWGFLAASPNDVPMAQGFLPPLPKKSYALLPFFKVTTDFFPF